MPKHLTLAGPAALEVDPIKRSRFIVHATPVSSADEALAFIEQVRSLYPDAGHHCFAWRLGVGDGGFRVSDDGEPSGTAGMPILNHIDGAELRNVVFVVVRYFGGTKLGKGGLIRAYGGAAGALIQAVEAIEVEETRTVEVRCSYRDQGTVSSVLRRYELSPFDTEFSEEVVLRVRVPVDHLDALHHAVAEATGGRAISRPCIVQG